MTLLFYLLFLEYFQMMDTKHIILGVIMWLGHIMFLCACANIYDKQINKIIEQINTLTKEVIKH